MAGMSWLAGQSVTFEEALEAGQEVAAAAVAAGPRLPPKDLTRLYPSTMQDAVSMVHARLEDSKKKMAQSKQKSKSKSGAVHTATDSHFPGARAGGGEPSAFWMYVEDHFRDFTQEDLRCLLPLLLGPRADPALKVPPAGRRLDDEQEQQRRHTAAKAAAEAARAAAVAAATRGGSEWDGGVDSRSNGLEGSPEAERRSSRLVSRSCREEEIRRQEQLEEEAAAAASIAEQAEAAALAAAARAMAVVPTTASGAPAAQLLDVLPEQRLALLIEQLSELMRLAGMEPLPLSGSPSVQASLAKLRAAASSTAATSELDGAARAEVQGWLQQQLSPLSEQLGCSLKVLPPWAERVANRAKCVAKGGTAAAAGSTHQQQQAQGASDNVGNGLPSAAAAADAPAAKVPTAAYIHPYTELMLRHPVQQHTMQQAVEAQAPETLLPSRQTTAAREDVAAAAAAAAGAEGCAAANGSAGEVDVSTPAASLLAATPASAGFLLEVPSLADLSCLSEQRTQLTGGGAAGGGDTAGTAGMGSQMLLDGLAFDLCAAGAASPMDVAALGSGSTALARASGRARGISNYALLAGKKGGSRSHTGPPKKAARAASSRQEVDLGPQHPVARAVAALVAAGDPNSSAAGHWDGRAGGCSQLLAAAPEDEVLAEMLALQNELMQQTAVNRSRLLPALAAVLGELDERREAAAQQAREEEEVKAWIVKVRDIKRQQHRQRREEAHHEALAAKKQTIMASPRPVLGRQRGSQQLQNGESVRDGSPALEYALRPNERFDVLAQRTPAQEALCAVCMDGDSVPPNEIVFCERCDVAVHQHCYGIPVVPEDEWLCDPCKDHEAAMAAQGAAPSAIRPPSWHENRTPLEGGARSVKCVLCPIKYGAFKRAEDGRRWVHSACALWLPETFVAAREVAGVGRQEYVGGLEKIRPERWNERCAICGLVDGAVMACQQPGGCSNTFHVLCARNIGLHLAVRSDPSRKSALQYRIYCALHSDAQQDRDEKLRVERREKVAQQQQKESKARAAERAAAAKQAVVAAEAERHTLFLLRANLEMTRMLCDVTKRRERLKKQLLGLQHQQYRQLQRKAPLQALAWLQHHQQRRQQQYAAVDAAAAAAAGPMAMAAPAGLAPVPQMGQLQLLPPFAMPVPVPSQQQQQQQQQAAAVASMLSQNGMAGLQMPGGLPFMPAPQMPQQQQQQQQILLPQAQAPPSFALDMFAQQPQHNFFMHHPQQQQTGGMGAPFSGLPMQLAQHQNQQQQHQQQASAGHQLPAHASGLLMGMPGSSAAAAQASADMAAMFGGSTGAAAAVPPGLMQGMQMHMARQQQQQQLQQAHRLGLMGPAAAAPGQQQQGQQPGMLPGLLVGGAADAAPSPRAPRAAAAAAAAPAAGKAGSVSPQPSGSSGGGAWGRPKRGAGPGFISGGSSKRQRRTASAEAQAAPQQAAPTPPAAHMPAGFVPVTGGGSDAGAAVAAVASPGGAAAAAGRRQRVASVKVRESMIQRERQMTAEEAEVLNSQLPQPFIYLPAEELEQKLGSPSTARARAAAAAGGGTGGSHQRQPKPRSKLGGK